MRTAVIMFDMLHLRVAILLTTCMSSHAIMLTISGFEPITCTLQVCRTADCANEAAGSKSLSTDFKHRVPTWSQQYQKAPLQVCLC